MRLSNCLFAVLWGAAVVLHLIAVAGPAHAQARERKDAAEAVQEGSVTNWMEYYRRERNLPQGGGSPAPKPAEAPAPVPSEPRQR